MTHARLSPSSSSRWLVCTASVKACEAYEDTTNEASAWGTTVHTIGEKLLLGEDVAVGDTIEGAVVDDEMMECAVDYANYVMSYKKEDSTMMIEEQYDLSFIAPDTFGTGDAAILDGTTLHIFDLKTGRNKVSAEDNSQLKLYALGAMHKLKDEYIDEVVLHIVQTRIGHIDSWEISVDELESFGEFAKRQARAILEDNTSFNPSETACRWCLHKVNCEALMTHVEAVVKGDFEDLNEVKIEDAKKDHIARLLKNKGLITSLIADAEEVAINRMMAGEEIEGFKLVESRTNRKWDEENKDKIEKYLVRKLKKDGAYKQTLITPTQAIKKLDDKSKKYIEKYIVKPEGKPTIAPLSDKRKALNPVMDDFDEL